MKKLKGLDLVLKQSALYLGKGENYALLSYNYVGEMVTISFYPKKSYTLKEVMGRREELKLAGIFSMILEGNQCLTESNVKEFVEDVKFYVENVLCPTDDLKGKPSEFVDYFRKLVQ